jgi:hypothetical protein
LSHDRIDLGNIDNPLPTLWLTRWRLLLLHDWLVMYLRRRGSLLDRLLMILNWRLLEWS